MSIKEVLQKYLSKERIRDIQDFVEELYQMEYDILVLMARKFFNLFCVFHEMNCEEYRKLEIPYEQEHKTIVTNRALPLLKSTLSGMKHTGNKRVIVADDIIIHGRSIKIVYNQIKHYCPDIDIYLSCYMKNDEIESECNDIQDKVWYHYLVDTDKWRRLSDEIIQIFYLSGRPYISYLPYYTLDIDWTWLMDHLEKKRRYNIASADMRYYGIQGYMYIGDEFAGFRKLPFVKTCCIRLYHYAPIKKVMAIPYCSVDVMKDEYLQKVSDKIRKYYYTSDYHKLLKANHGADDMRIMELEYTLSCWTAQIFFGKIHLKNYIWNRDVEKYNFVTRILPDHGLSTQEIEEALTDLITLAFRPSEPQLVGFDRVLKDRFLELEKKYFKQINLWDKTFHNEVYSDYIQRFLENYLLVNGAIDEEEYKQSIKGDNSGKNERHLGLPITFILEHMRNMYKEWREETPESCMYKCYAAILCAADSGKGTIVTRYSHEAELSESLIYAGEQNYKFYENTNYPFLYGLYIIEQMGGTDQEKTAFKTNFMQYLQDNNIFYIEEEMSQIMQENVSQRFGRFLLNSFEKHSQKGSIESMALNEAVSEALRICGKR